MRDTCSYEYLITIAQCSCREAHLGDNMRPFYGNVPQKNSMMCSPVYGWPLSDLNPQCSEPYAKVLM